MEVEITNDHCPCAAKHNGNVVSDEKAHEPVEKVRESLTFSIER
jgi:hypothetical protein